MTVSEEIIESQGMADSVRYIAENLLDDTHYRTIHQSLASKWDKLHSLSAAVRLMQTYGVELTQAEEQQLHSMDESRQIEALVAKMPQQSNEQFQHFFLQLQLLVSTATQVRRALEAGRPDLVQEALDDAEKTGISSYILRVAIVQAGSEVMNLKSQFDMWMKDADAKMSRYIRGQQDAMIAQKKLAAAQAELTNFTTGQSKKTQSVLVSLCGGQSKALVGITFNGWEHAWRQEKLEREVRKEYEWRLEKSEKALADYKAEQLKNAKGVLGRNAAANDQMLLAETLMIWKKLPQMIKAEKDAEEQIEALNSKIAHCKDAQKEATKRVMERMGLAGDKALQQAIWVAFQQNMESEKKERQLAEKEAAAKKVVEENLKKQSEGARKVLSGIAGGADGGVTICWRAWQSYWDDIKKQNEIEDLLENSKTKFSMFGNKNKMSGMSVMERQAYVVDQMLLLRCFNALRLEGRTSAAMAGYHAKIDAKRQQLMGVQQMFRTFAMELESGLKAGDNSSRGDRKVMSKSEGAVSLPNIHSKPSSAGGRGGDAARGTPTRHDRDAPQPRQAWG